MPGLREKVIAEDSGLIGSAIADFNRDGRPDIAAVIAQGRQELILLINNGDETFTRHVLDRHTPSWGGNSLNAADFDGDGDMDLVVLNGDNVAGNHIGKIVPAPRPQHGIRVYRNDGDLKFAQQFYYRMHGAIRSVVRDFDGDGDPDIAAIALFPQWSQDEPETFVYLENKGRFQLRAPVHRPGILRRLVLHRGGRRQRRWQDRHRPRPRQLPRAGAARLDHGPQGHAGARRQGAERHVPAEPVL